MLCSTLQQQYKAQIELLIQDLLSQCTPGSGRVPEGTPMSQGFLQEEGAWQGWVHARWVVQVVNKWNDRFSHSGGKKRCRQFLWPLLSDLTTKHFLPSPGARQVTACLTWQVNSPYPEHPTLHLIARLPQPLLQHPSGLPIQKPHSEVTLKTSGPQIPTRPHRHPIHSCPTK